ncbi:MAG: hypothetical protein GEU82_18165 [Luteitalea sp.]|nr:hypothetical protein [Luteitalea sp.]
MKQTIRLLAALGLMLLPAGVAAHHSFSAEFDFQKPVVLVGVLTRMEWINPHGWIHLDVKGKDGTVVNWAVETGAPNALLRRGLRKTSFPLGVEITVTGYLAKSGKPIANGRTYARAIRHIHIDGTKHPHGPIEWWLGDSRGRWEEDTLVVDTVHFTNQTWLDRSGNFHSENLHVVERFTPDGPDHIAYRATMKTRKRSAGHGTSKRSCTGARKGTSSCWSSTATDSNTNRSIPRKECSCHEKDISSGPRLRKERRAPDARTDDMSAGDPTWRAAARWPTDRASDRRGVETTRPR